MAELGEIRLLTPALQSRLRSSIAITSYAQCVEELVLNALDANANCVAVRVDLTIGKMQVVDNGIGMSAEQLEYVGTRYATSKCHDIEDLENLGHYGYRGEALASICDICHIVEIESRSKLNTQCYVRIFEEKQPHKVQLTTVPRPSAGSTVTVHNLFHQMPVRRKCMNLVTELELIRQRMEAIALIHPSVSLSLRNDVNGNKLLQTHKSNSVHSAFMHLFGGSRNRHLCSVSSSRNQFTVNGYIAKEGHFNKNLQFVYVNDRFVLKTKIHKLINHLISKSSIIRKRGQAKSTGTTDLTSSPTRSADRYGVFVMNVSCPLSEYDITFDPAKTLVEFKDWDGLLKCVQHMVQGFLQDEGFLQKSESAQVTAASLSPGSSKDGEKPDADTSIKKYGKGISATDITSNLHSLTVRRQKHVQKSSDICNTEPSSEITHDEKVAKSGEREQISEESNLGEKDDDEESDNVPGGILAAAKSLSVTIISASKSSVSNEESVLHVQRRHSSINKGKHHGKSTKSGRTGHKGKNFSELHLDGKERSRLATHITKERLSISLKKTNSSPGGLLCLRELFKPPNLEDPNVLMKRIRTGLSSVKSQTVQRNSTTKSDESAKEPFKMPNCQILMEKMQKTFKDLAPKDTSGEITLPLGSLCEGTSSETNEAVKAVSCSIDANASLGSVEKILSDMDELKNKLRQESHSSQPTAVENVDDISHMPDQSPSAVVEHNVTDQHLPVDISEQLVQREPEPDYNDSRAVQTDTVHKRMDVPPREISLVPPPTNELPDLSGNFHKAYPDSNYHDGKSLHVLEAGYSSSSRKLYINDEPQTDGRSTRNQNKKIDMDSMFPLLTSSQEEDQEVTGEFDSQLGLGPVNPKPVSSVQKSSSSNFPRSDLYNHFAPGYMYLSGQRKRPSTVESHARSDTKISRVLDEPVKPARFDLLSIRKDEDDDEFDEIWKEKFWGKKHSWHPSRPVINEDDLDPRTEAMNTREHSSPVDSLMKTIAQAERKVAQLAETTGLDNPSSEFLELSPAFQPFANPHSRQTIHGLENKPSSLGFGQTLRHEERKYVFESVAATSTLPFIVGTPMEVQINQRKDRYDDVSLDKETSHAYSTHSDTRKVTFLEQMAMSDNTHRVEVSRVDEDNLYSMPVRRNPVSSVLTTIGDDEQNKVQGNENGLWYKNVGKRSFVDSLEEAMAEAKKKKVPTATLR